MVKASHIERDYVRALRSKGHSWSAVARMTGAAEVDLRRLFDGLVFSPQSASTVMVPASQDRLIDALKLGGVAHGHAQVIARLWKAGGEVVTAATAVQGLLAEPASGEGGTDKQQKAFFKASLTAASKLGIEFLATPTKGALTPQGVAFLNGLAGIQ
ncbi:hypothetical protein [Brevundimonas sp.]|uniref:hypothetical protein n=1 Tax=Brevundimonas sp. TaxID=1871086 RepID=UPI0028986EE7|nr:hypothetical protein [Brevundimonas sp.]